MFDDITILLEELTELKGNIPEDKFDTVRDILEDLLLIINE